MKKLFFIVLVWLISITTSGQTTELKGALGVSFGCNKEEVRTMMRAKYPEAVFDQEKNNVLYYEGGSWLNRKVALWGFGFTADNELHSIIIVIPPVHNSLTFDTYDAVVKDLSVKYGQPHNQIENFKYPYDSKDKEDHGITALKAGKCTVMSFWEYPNPLGTNDNEANCILVEITLSLATKVTYQNGVLFYKNKKQVDSKNLNEM